jgi:hypothetical protein
VVIGAGGVAAANLGVFGGSSHNAGSTAGGASDSQAKSSTGDTAPSTAPSGSQSREALGAAALPELRAGSFASDVSSLLHRRTALSAPGQAPDASSGTTQKSPGSQARQRAADSLKNLACPGPRITDGALPTPVRYDGRLAVLVVHPERGGHQLVEAWDCRGDRRLTDATITP